MMQGLFPYGCPSVMAGPYLAMGHKATRSETASFFRFGIAELT